MIVHHKHRFQNALMRGPVSALARFQARPMLDRAGQPVVIEGDHRLVAKVQSRDGGALALQIARDPSIPDPYSDRASGLRRLALTRLSAHLPAAFESIPEGMDLEGRTQPATISAWVSGPSLLDAAMRLCTEANGAVLRALASSIARALNDLRASSFAHDALNPGNALVGEGGVLVFTGLGRATWDGGPGPSTPLPVNAYRHPDADGDPFAEDAFAALVMYASLLVLADNPALRSMESGVSADARPLVFGSRDLADPEASPVFARVLSGTSAETREVVEALRTAATQPADEIERWAAVMSGFRRIDISSYLRKRPGHEYEDGGSDAPSPTAWGVPSWSQDAVDEPVPSNLADDGASSAPTWRAATAPERDPWESWRSGSLTSDLPPERVPDRSELPTWPEEHARPAREPFQIPAPTPRRQRRVGSDSIQDAAASADPGDGDRAQSAQNRANVDLQQSRRQFFSALSARDESTVNALWPQMATDPVGRTAMLAVQELAGRSLRERIRSEQRQGRHESAAMLAVSSSSAGIAIDPELRRRLRSTAHRAMTRERLESALGSDDLELLAELAVSGELLELDDTDRHTLQRVLRAIRWPGLVSALATDDDQIIVDAFDPELWESGRALSPEARARIGQAMARIDWRTQVRLALRNRDAESLEALYQKPPAAALDRLSASERRRCRRLIEQRHALAELHRSVAQLDDDAIVRALNHVERVGARITDRATWSAIQQIVERTSMVEEMIAAVDAIPMDVGKLAHLVPAARTMGYDRDLRLRGKYALDDLERVLVQHAHLRRVRAALDKDDNAGIVLVAVPDPYGSLDLLTEAERSRIALAIQQQRRMDRKGVAARFQAS